MNVKKTFWIFGLIPIFIITFCSFILNQLVKSYESEILNFLYLIFFIIYLLSPLLIIYSSYRTYKNFSKKLQGFFAFILQLIILITLWLVPLIFIFGIGYYFTLINLLNINP